MGLDNNDEIARFPDHQCRSIRSRLRYRLIQRLAKNDPVMLNTIMITPPGWAIARREFGQGGLLVNNTWLSQPDYVFVPGTLIMWRDDQGRLQW